MEPAQSVRFLDRTTPPHIATLIIMTGVAAMAMNMFLPSLPSMTQYFHTEYRLTQLSVAVFLAVNGALQLLIGPISDRYGRRPVTIGGFAFFVLGTLGCLFATNIYVFLAFRAVQAGSVVAMVLSRAAIRDTHPQEAAASMIGYVTMGMAVVPMITPALGGFLDQHFSWKATFLIYLVSGLGVIWLVWADFGETNRQKSTSFGQQFRDIPELLKSPRFWGYAVVTAGSSGAFFAYLGGAPFVGSTLFGLDPAEVGFFFGAPAGGYIVGNFISARGSIRLGINRLILVGTIVTVVSVLLAFELAYLGAESPWAFFAPMSLLGLGNGLVMPNGIAGTISVRPKLVGTASGFGGALMIGGGAGLAAWSGSLLSVESGSFPLLYIQLGVTLVSLFSILLVMRRERRLLRS